MSHPHVTEDYSCGTCGSTQGQECETCGKVEHEMTDEEAREMGRELVRLEESKQRFFQTVKRILNTVY